MSLRHRSELRNPAVFFVTLTTFNHNALLESKNARQISVDVLLETAKLRTLRITAYVIMNTHIHFIAFFPGGGPQLSSFVNTIKGIIRKRLQGNLRMWDRRFDDKIVRNVKMLIDDIYYIHQNPVRAGLVANEVDYHFSSAGAWAGRVSDPRIVTRIDEISGE